LAALDDLDGDGTDDLAVGAPGDDDGEPDRGAVWILFMNDDGTVKGHQKISETEGGFSGELYYQNWFGAAAVATGDLDGDGIGDLTIGAPGTDEEDDLGVVWVLFMNDDGTVKSHQKIGNTDGGFEGQVEPGGEFGCSLTLLEDHDGDGFADLAVGAQQEEGFGHDQGAVWILFLDAETCAGDVTGDGLVDVLDLLAILAAWGQSGVPEDINNDGVVDVEDLLLLLAAWGECP
jgi:hypothetical protein